MLKVRPHLSEVRFNMEGNLRSAALWRHEVFARAEELEMLTRWMAADAEPHLVEAVQMHLAAARRAAARTRPLPSLLPAIISGASIQSAMYNLDAAEVNLLRLAPLEYLKSNLPNLVAAAAEVLPAKDPRLIRLIQLDAPQEGTAVPTTVDRDAIVAAISAAKKAALQAQARVRAFRNVILVATALALLIGVALAMIGLFAPESIPLCQTNYGLESVELTCPASGTEPQPADTLIVQFAGIMGATVAAVFALRKVRGTTDPYSVPVALALLKLPTGALTGVLGLLMIRGGFVPGFTGLDSAAQVIGWAIIFGYSQELFTAVVDRQAANVLGASPASQLATGEQQPARNTRNSNGE
jgi:hypothetical protein